MIYSVCDELDQTIWLLIKCCNVVVVYNASTTEMKTNCDNIVKIPTMQQPSGLKINPSAEDCFTSNKEWDVRGLQNEKKKKKAGELGLTFDSSIWGLGMNLQIIVTPLAPRIEKKGSSRHYSSFKVNEGAFLLLLLLLAPSALTFLLWTLRTIELEQNERNFASNTYRTHGPWINCTLQKCNTFI